VHLGASGRLPDRLPEVLNDEADRPLPDLPQSSIRRTVRPAISPSEVKIYLQPPPSFEEVAILHASADSVFGTGGQGSADEVIQRLKEQAAKLSANGIVLEGMSDQQTGSLGGGRGLDRGQSTPLFPTRRHGWRTSFGSVHYRARRGA
jgi:hypothetical protein